MEVQRQSGVSSCVNSYGGEVETFSQHIIKASTVDTLKFLNDESFELRDRFRDEIACMPMLMLWKRVRVMSSIH